MLTSVTMGWSSILKSLFTVFVFSILVVGSVEGYTCLQATCGNGNCFEPLTTCDTTVGCFNQIQKLEAPLPGSNQVLEQKGCNTDTKTCGLEFSATLGSQQTFKYKNQCCTTDKCNKENIALSRSSEINGVECTACYSEQNKTCSTITTLKCTGAERKCLEVTGTDQSSNLIFYGKGCATENTCSLDMNVFNNIKIKTLCIPATNGSPTFKSIASLPIVLLLLKILL